MPSDRTTTSDAADGPLADHGWATPLINEAYVLGKGLKDTPGAVIDSASEAWNHHKGALATEVATSTIVGLGVGYLTSGFGVRGLIGRGLGTAFGISFLSEGIKPFKEACSSAWTARTEGELDAASQQFSKKLGDFTFDGLLMTPGALAGNYAGNKLAFKVSEGMKLPSLTDLVGKGTAAETVKLTEPVVGAEKPATTEVKEGADAVAPGGRIRSNYRFVKLDPNSKVNPQFDVAIEVPADLLKGQLSLDHHGTGATAETPSAIEQALALPASEVPKPGSRLATVKEDADSIGAMAVLANRAEGRPVNEDLVHAIGLRDRGKNVRLEDPDLRDMMAAIQDTVKSGREMHKKVFFLKDCLDGSVRMDAVRERAAWRRQSSREQHTRIEDTLEVKPYKDIRDIVLIKSTDTAALSHGYKYAPISILHVDSPNFQRLRVGVEENSTKGKYFGRALKELQGMEPGWGGRSSILASPHGRNTELTQTQVADVVSKYIDPPKYKQIYWDALDFLSKTRPIAWFVKS